MLNAWRGGSFFADVFDDDAARRIDPAAVAAEMGEDADSVNNGFGSDVNAFDLFNDVSQGEAQVRGAALVQIQGVGVAIDGALGKLVELSDGLRAAPLEEFLLDLLALRVLADGAFALVS